VPPGEVVARIAEAGGRVTINVADNGIGLPVERDRIVEPYMTTRSRGTGLGLAIVKKIVEEHMGSVSFSDRADGGTVVTLSFDAAALRALAVPDDPDAARPDENDEDRLQILTRTRNLTP
jgi:two-component system, NtrC family, nitrogen regulation sensor histidine kinase NtrY